MFMFRMKMTKKISMLRMPPPGCSLRLTVSGNSLFVFNMYLSPSVCHTVMMFRMKMTKKISMLRMPPPGCSLRLTVSGNSLFVLSV